jgi:5'(3')-deoxyribonucleotidase
MVIGIDADGVIVDLLTKWVERYNELYHDDLSTVAFAKNHDVHNAVKTSCGEKVYDIIKEPGFFEDLPELPGAIATINHLMHLGHQVNVITSYSESAEIAKGKVLWFSKFLPLLMEKKGLILCPAKMKKHVKCDVFVDDYEKNIRAYWWENSPMKVEPIMVKAVHNCYSKWPFKIERLAELPNYLESIGMFKV